jgi:hypothetical protein
VSSLARLLEPTIVTIRAAVRPFAARARLGPPTPRPAPDRDRGHRDGGEMIRAGEGIIVPVLVAN